MSRNVPLPLNFPNSIESLPKPIRFTSQDSEQNAAAAAAASTFIHWCTNVINDA